MKIWKKTIVLCLTNKRLMFLLYSELKMNSEKRANNRKKMGKIHEWFTDKVRTNVS